MSFAAKVAALRSFFGVPDNEPLPVAVQRMNVVMGIDVAGPLPKQVDELVSETGVTVAAADAPAAPEAHVAVGVPVVGWCVGKILSRNTDARKTAKLADGNTAKKNFNIFYEIDGEEVASVLRADEYGGDEDFSWVLLEPAEGA